MKSIFQIALLVYLGLGLYLYIKQRSFIYFPVAETPKASNNRLFSNEDHTIKVSILNEDSKKAIIYFGGNAENVEYNSHEFSTNLSEYAIYLVNYRGYGGSSGTPTEEAIYSDALSIHDEIIKDHESISIIGRSLGSAVATYVASKRPIDKLVLITPFDSVQSVAQSQFPIYPMGLLLKDKHDSYSRVKNIQGKTLIIAAELDQIIKMSHTKRLLEGFNSKVEFHVIEGADHNNIASSPRYYEILDEFM